AEVALEGPGVDRVRGVFAEAGPADGPEVDDDAGLVRADGAELAQDGEHLALAGPAVDLALDALPKVVGVDAGDGQAGLAQVAGQLAEVGAGGVVVVAGPVRLVLDEDDGPAA